MHRPNSKQCRRGISLRRGLGEGRRKKYLSGFYAKLHMGHYPKPNDFLFFALLGVKNQRESTPGTLQKS